MPRSRQRAWNILAGLVFLVGVCGYAGSLMPQGWQVLAQEDEVQAIRREIDELTAKIAELQKTSESLSSQVQTLNSQINLNEKKIAVTEAEIRILNAQIRDLTQRIDGLEVSLKDLSVALVERVQQQYKHYQEDPLTRLLATAGMSNFFVESKYAAQLREHTQQLLLDTEMKRQVYDEEKEKKQEKQDEVAALQQRLEQQRADLSRQRNEKNALLQITKNDEKQYQERLARALAELNAIQSIIAGRGSESSVGDIKSGDRIATIIKGSSPCSTGSHLHFEVVKNGVHVNPAEYLRGVDIKWQNSPDGPFGFGGSWDWPVNDAAAVNQGYGMTWFARPGGYSRRGAYGGAPHTGIDMVSKSGDLTVKAVRDGALFRGSIACGGGNLRYVRVKHSDEFSTYYLHVNY